MYKSYRSNIKLYTGPHGSIRPHMGPYLWPEVNKNQVEKVEINISDRDFFLGLVQGDDLT